MPPVAVRPSSPPTAALEGLTTLASALGHEVSDASIWLQALTHRSFTNERPDLAPDHNETLEFLGDSVVGLAAAMLLRASFPGAREGELTRRRADLVCERTLAKIATSLDLGPLLRLGRGEERSGGRTKARLLASALEAVIAAVLLDASTEAALAVAKRLLEPHLDAMAPGEGDFKSRVQEHLQAEGRGTPRYELVGHEGPEHARTFFVAIQVEGRELARGQGRSKLEAEQAAAREAFGLLREPEPASGGGPT
ncbi:MAG: ribonuclease III [Sandaracinaceae bacterium]|nr:ribonuclease III [Sandaracinaceae bacterium]